MIESRVLTEEEIKVFHSIYNKYILYLNEIDESPVKQKFIDFIWWTSRQKFIIKE